MVSLRCLGGFAGLVPVFRCFGGFGGSGDRWFRFNGFISVFRVLEHAIYTHIKPLNLFCVIFILGLAKQIITTKTL